MEQLPAPLGALAGLRLRVYRDCADAEGLARLREQLEQAWQSPAEPAELPVVVRQGVAYRIAGRIAPWLAELDRGLAALEAAGARQPRAELALAAALGDPVRAAALLDDGRQRLEALLRSGAGERYQAALSAACALAEPLLLLRRLAPDDARADQLESRLEALLDEAQGPAAGSAGYLVAELVRVRAVTGRLAEAEALLASRPLPARARRAAMAAVVMARRRGASSLADLARGLPEGDRDDLLRLVLAQADTVSGDERWAATAFLADAPRRATARLELLDALLADGDPRTATALWESWHEPDLAMLTRRPRAAQ